MNRLAPLCLQAPTPIWEAQHNKTTGIFHSSTYIQAAKGLGLLRKKGDGTKRKGSVGKGFMSMKKQASASFKAEAVSSSSNSIITLSLST